MKSASIFCETLNDDQRLKVPARLFGSQSFALRIEPAVYWLADQLSPNYNGGLWAMHSLTNGGFYMSPQCATSFEVAAMNGANAVMSSDAFGITVCLYAYSHLSFGEQHWSLACAEQYHLLRDWAIESAEASAIFAAID